MDIKWTPPADDGGAPIENYIIEKRSRYGRWEPGAEVSGGQTAGTVKDLTPGEEYEFRIIAVNKGGHSEPSDPSDPKVAKPRKCNYIGGRFESHLFFKRKRRAWHEGSKKRGKRGRKKGVLQLQLSELY